MSADTLSGGNVEPRALEDEMRSAYLDYAMSVIVGRALPDVRDGLKPVHRRVLYTMSELGLGPTRPFSKCARTVGEVMGKYHPHGDSAIYDALVRLAQDFSMRYPLVDGQGNFGSIDDDPAAAMRYTEARLDRLATEMLRDLDRDTVDFIPTYDSQNSEPVRPAGALPQPARQRLGRHRRRHGDEHPAAQPARGHRRDDRLHRRSADQERPAGRRDREADAPHQGPGLPDRRHDPRMAGIRDAYETGRGRVRVQAKVGIEDIGQGKEALIVTELPYQVKKGGDSGLIVKIADLVHDKKIPEISDIRDESDRHGMRLVIELKRGTIPKVALNKLFKHTSMQTTFGVNMVALVDGVPRTLSLCEVIGHYVDHQREVVVRRAKHELAELTRRVHVLEGLLVALANLDEVISLIRGSANREAARGELMTRFELSEIQATAILDLRLSQLTALEVEDVRQEHTDKLERIGELRTLLGDEQQVFALIKDELREVSERFADDRRTDITASEDEIDIEDLIADQQMVITITKTGYIKSLPLTTYRQQQRGGRGVTGMDMKDGDYIEHLFVCSSHDFLLFFSNRGKVYRSKVYELPEASRTAKGRALVNVLPLAEGERIQSVLSTRDFTESKYLVFATRGGMVKKTELRLYNTPIKADGIIAIRINDGDELVAVRNVDEGDTVIMVSRSGQASRFEETRVRGMGRATAGVKGMNVSQKDNYLLAMDVARPDQDLLVVTENGFGKRTAIDDYPIKGRGTMGVKTIALTDKKGALAGALVVREHDDLVFISTNGMVQRTSVRGINRYGRASQGVKVMNMKEDDTVSAVALVVEGETGAMVEDGLTDAPLGEVLEDIADEDIADEGVADDVVDEPDVTDDEE